MPPVAAPRSPQRRTAKPESDPRYRAVTDKLKSDSQKLKKHAPAAQKSREASGAAKAPPNERLASAKAQVVEQAKEAPTPKPQPASFKALLRAQIEQAMPKTLGETEQFMGAGQAGALKQSLDGNVDAQKQRATGPIDAATQKAPDPGAVPALPSTALPAEPKLPAPGVDGAAAMPAPLPASDVSLDQSKQDTSRQLADNQIKPESLQRANDPRFSAVTGAQAQVAAQADAGPKTYRAKETGLLGKAQAGAKGMAAKGVNLLIGTRGKGQQQVLTRQQQQAAKEEAERKQVADKVESLFTRTKQKVEKLLEGLDTEVSAMFDSGVDAALSAMKTYVDDKIFKYKLDRYLSIPVVGLARWLRDQALGLPSEVNAFYQQGRKVFQTTMDTLIDRVANLVEGRLAQAKAEVTTGQNEIKTYVAGLPANLKAAGQAAEKAVNDRFTELSQGIDDKKNELASSLAQKYKEAFDKADESLKQMQDENKGLLQKFAEKLGEVIKALMEFKAKLMGILRKGADAIQLILNDPIAFLGNLLAAVKGGFNAFVANIWTHLKKGFMTWLFGSLAAMGIALPADLSLPSILKLVLDVLGITYDKMRAKAVTLLGERAVGLIEKAAEYVKELVTGGPAKLWEKVKEDLAGLKEMVIDAIQSWLIDTVVKQAVTKVVSMFNPAGAIVQAVIAIYNVVMFVIEKAQQIMALIEAVVNSVYAIATGAIGGAISWIEKSLASAIPVVIGFLARLLGLSGITQKIQEFIKKIQSKVDKAIDKAIAKVVSVVKKLFGAAKAGAKKLLQWWKKTLPFSGGGESHTIKFDGSESNAKLTIHTKPKKVIEFVKDFLEVKGTAADIASAKAWDAKITDTQQQLMVAKKADDEAKMESLGKVLDSQLEALSKVLQTLLKTGEAEGSQENPVQVDYPKRRASNYPTMYAGPRVGTSLRINQDWLKPLVGQPNNVAKAALLAIPALKKAKLDKNPGFIAWTSTVQAYSPMTKTTLGGKGIGMSPEFASVGPGKLLNYTTKAGTGGGHKINDIFKPYGFVPSSNGGEGLDGDHVLERQLGGPDEPINLWPLQKSENRSSGSLVKSMTVKFKGEEMTVHQARAKRKKESLYLLVRSTKG